MLDESSAIINDKATNEINEHITLYEMQVAFQMELDQMVQEVLRESTKKKLKVRFTGKLLYSYIKLIIQKMQLWQKEFQ